MFFFLGVGSLIALVLLLRGNAPSTPQVLPDGVLRPTVVAVSSPSPTPNLVRPHATSSGHVIARAAPASDGMTFQSPLPPVEDVPALPPAVITYTVRAGDHLASIAARFGIQRETVIWANEELEFDPGLLHIGQVLYILPVDGVYYTVKEGDTLDEIATLFRVTVETIANFEYNDIERDGSVVTGQKLVIPGGRKPFRPIVVPLQVTPVPLDSTRDSQGFIWPVRGEITQGFWDLHRAIDIDGKHNDLVLAADAGTVVYAAWDLSGYGYLVIVDHGNGFVTYYAHLYGFYVQVGDLVDQGEPIGALGNTGNSTGPHLHFEIREHGVHRNPLALLPQGE